jgi:1-acyl-sn-glycerol-3-phosphate acyltransferase
MFYKIARKILSFFLRLFFRIEVNGLDNIPMDDRLIICANHGSNWDPVLISIAFPKQIHWMAKKELFKNKVLSFILLKLGAFPVDRQDSDITAVKNALRVLKANKILGIFPEGTRVDSPDLSNTKAGISLLAIKSKSLILPIYIKRTYKVFNKVNINIGDPIDLSDNFNKKLNNEEYLSISKDILKSIYALGELNP